MSNFKTERAEVVVDIAIDAATHQVPVADNTITTQPERDQDRLLSLLLRMGERYLKNGSPNQALELFLSLVEGYPDTAQANSAKERLFDICNRYETEGLFHQARALYQRLLS